MKRRDRDTVGSAGITTASPQPTMPCRECNGIGVSRFNTSLICGVCDGTREDPSSPVWKVTP